MSEQEYEKFLVSQSDRKKELLPYENFVKERLRLFRDTSAAQMHDRLKEHHAGFPKVNPKTVFNFVHWVRDKYNLPVASAPRHYEVVEELPYGKQAQVDFGEYTIRTSSHTCLYSKRTRYRWLIEIKFLKPYALHAVKAVPLTYTVRKDNAISWKGNLYSLPWGTYTGRGCMVAVRGEQDVLKSSMHPGIIRSARIRYHSSARVLKLSTPITSATSLWLSIC